MRRQRKPRGLKRRSHSAVAVVGAKGPVERACGRCGFVLGTNRGRCPQCFDAWADERMAQYFDWLVENSFPPRTGEEMGKQLALHGPLLIPR